VRLADHQQRQEERVQQQGKTSNWRPVWLNLDSNWALIDLGDIASQYLVNTVAVRPDLRYGHYLADDEFVTLGKESPASMPIIKRRRFSRSGLRHLNQLALLMVTRRPTGKKYNNLLFGMIFDNIRTTMNVNSVTLPQLAPARPEQARWYFFRECDTRRGRF
jgi:hypothetical protein